MLAVRYAFDTLSYCVITKLYLLSFKLNVSKTILSKYNNNLHHNFTIQKRFHVAASRWLAMYHVSGIF